MMLFNKMRERGIRFTLQALGWRVKTHAYKHWLAFSNRFDIYSYQQWMAVHEPSEAELAAQRKAGPSTNTRHGFAVFILCETPSDLLLARTLRSLVSQTYPDWVGIVLLPGDEGETQSLLYQFGADPRLRFCPMDLDAPDIHEPLLRETDATFTAVLSAGDTLSPNAFFEAAVYASESQQVDILYFDEDRYAPGSNQRLAPFFKPNWSPELMISVNYLRQAFFRRELLLEALQPAFSWGDAVFRAVEKASAIRHIPKVYLHNGSTARLTKQKKAPDYWDPASHIHDVAAHLERTGADQVKVTRESDHLIHARWAVQGKRVSIIIPNKDAAQTLERCLTSIFKRTAYHPFEVVIVDNDSQDPQTLAYYQRLKAHEDVRMIEGGTEFNYSAFNNIGARYANGDYLLFLNNDVEVLTAEWLEELVRWVERPGVGIVGGKLLFPDQSIQHAGIVVGLEGHASHIFMGAQEGRQGPFGSVDWYRNFSAVTGACMLVRKEVFNSLNGFNEEYRLAFSDVEICLRAIRAGLRVVYTPFARLIHDEGSTRAHLIPKEDIVQACGDFEEVLLQGDPYFNPNLSYAYRIPSYRQTRDQAPMERVRRIVEIS